MMKTAKQLIKNGLIHLAPIFGRHRFTFGRGHLLILTYHRILPVDDPRRALEQPGMIVTEQTFARQLAWLKDHFSFIKLSDWLQQAVNNSTALPKQACAITFDDGWRDNFDYAFPILQQFKVPATIFLVSSLVGSETDFWPGQLAKLLKDTAQHRSDAWNTELFKWLKDETIQYAFKQIPPNKQELDQIIEYCKRYSDQENLAFIQHARDTLGFSEQVERCLLNKAEISQMLHSGLIDIGSHTANHIRMSPELDKTVLQQELVDSKNSLQDRFNTAVRLFCYPNGDTSAEAVDIVKQEYLGACTTKPGWNTAATPAHLLKRISIHEDMSNTRDKLLFKISGWM